MLFQNKSRGLVTFHLSGATRRFAVEDKAAGVAMAVAELRHIDWGLVGLVAERERLHPVQTLRRRGGTRRR